AGVEGGLGGVVADPWLAGGVMGRAAGVAVSGPVGGAGAVRPHGQSTSRTLQPAFSADVRKVCARLTVSLAALTPSSVQFKSPTYSGIAVPPFLVPDRSGVLRGRKSRSCRRRGRGRRRRVRRRTPGD